MAILGLTVLASCSTNLGNDVKTLDLAKSVHPYGDADKAGNLFEVISLTDVFGPRVTARGKTVSIWPSGGSGRDFYAVLLPEEIEALFPDRAADAGPMVVHLRSRR